MPPWVSDLRCHGCGQLGSPKCQLLKCRSCCPGCEYHGGKVIDHVEMLMGGLKLFLRNDPQRSSRRVAVKHLAKAMLELLDHPDAEDEEGSCESSES